MPDQPSRVRLQLAAELQTARSLSGMNQRDLGTSIDLSQSMVARVERAERLLSRPAADKWLRTTKARPDVRDRVLALLEAAHTETGTWAELLASQRHLQDQSRDRNAGARLMQDFSPTVLPGLLQTADYARRIIALADVSGTIDRGAALAARIERQGVLHEPGERRFEFLTTERLLHWQPAPGVLAPQLAHLVAAAQLDTVSLAVLPDDYAGALPWHNFVVRHPADGSPAYVATELLHGAQTIEDPESVALYERLWAQMWDAAATGPDALDLIRSAGGTA